jgi:hypothetical protein
MRGYNMQHIGFNKNRPISFRTAQSTKLMASKLPCCRRRRLFIVPFFPLERRQQERKNEVLGDAIKSISQKITTVLEMAHQTERSTDALFCKAIY